MNDLSHLSAPKPGSSGRPVNKYNTLMNDLNPDAEKKKAPMRAVGGPKGKAVPDADDLDSLVNELSALEDKGTRWAPC
jgi:hypothetical protein